VKLVCSETKLQKTQRKLKGFAKSFSACLVKKPLAERIMLLAFAKLNDSLMIPSANGSSVINISERQIKNSP
jgi:hypothetical protein